MTKKMDVKYHGWSCFSLMWNGISILFDPFFRPMHGANWASLQDFKDVKLIFVTHGHYEHYLDTAPIVNNTGATVVSSKMVCDHLIQKYKISPKNLVAVEPFKETDVFGFKVTAFKWHHRYISFYKFFKGNFWTALQFAYYGLLHAPFSAPPYGYHLKGSDGVQLVNYNEGFSNLVDIKELEMFALKFNTDILLAGMQLNFEDYLGRGVGALKPKNVILFHPHEKLFERFKLQSSPPEVFISKIRQHLPGIPIHAPRPNETLQLII